ncbi:MAG: ATP-dependent zinc metalloprotease FtsH [Candidatus Roizmanbacteria bacterium GW2011_GWA2_32_13]|uniref:ATP-dependent zinc metalloprotease FtsH n=1 Tax=Candidatus Roizmanbacteria bacterium GW2011_GWA2_32_13 TaxID=1618475 RepID=A0A0F9YSY8_9BACT|nr:MAG: ATP-dependent zinc metalloprotease FtsH [Candidatus Roizmanbacteria bacterium GW2011_GWA2_32_13]
MKQNQKQNQNQKQKNNKKFFKKKSLNTISTLLRNFGLFVLILVILSGVFALFNGGLKTDAENISFSALIEKINQEQVKNIIVDQNRLTITLQNNEIKKSVKETESSLSELLIFYGVKEEIIKNLNIEVKTSNRNTFLLTTILGTLLPILLIGGFMWYLIRATQKKQGDAFGFGRAGARLDQNEKNKVTFKNVANLKEAKEELEDVVDFLKNPGKYHDIGAKIPRGVILMGSPGTGKTLLARAVSGEAGVPFFHISGSQFVEMFVGVGAARVRDLFKTAKKTAPSIIFIDEIDAVGRQRGTGLGGGHDEREQTLNQILVEMDGFDKETHVIVLAGTNRPDVLDPALLRPGRFDRRVVLDLPDIVAREEILAIHSKGKKMSDKINLKEIAEHTPGFSGADLENVLNEAAIATVKEKRNLILQSDLLLAIEKVMLGPEKKSRVFSKKEREITAYHEAGHALVAYNMPHSDPVRKVSIISRGHAGGYTLKLPTEDRSYHSYSQFLADLAMMMGGYSAEKIMFNEVTTGASSDLHKASELARDLVTKYGMSSDLGPISFNGFHNMVFLGKDMVDKRNYSEQVAAKIDMEIAKFINNAFKVAQDIIKEKKEDLKKIAKALLEKETLDGEQLKALLSNVS